MDKVKKSIEVIVQYLPDGKILPSTIIWEDGRKFDIDHVIDMQKMSTRKVGGWGWRYLVKVHHKEIALFYEEPCWYLEEQISEDQGGSSRPHSPDQSRHPHSPDYY